MTDIGLLCKSYAGDLAYATRMVSSFLRYNRDELELFIVVPEKDLSSFATLAGPHVTVLSEAPFTPHFTQEPVLGIREGYINQEIVKLAFWELGLLDNYFCVDSDAEFIRPFGRDDFLHDASTPYSVLVEDNELKVEPTYYREYWNSREAALRRIQSEVGLDDPIIRTCHGHQIFSAIVLASFRDDFLRPRGWSYLDALRVAPYEFSWYNMWLQKAEPIPIHQREPLVKVFHHQDQHLEYVLRGVSLADMARGYVGVVVNSNYSRDMGVIDADATPAASLSRYLSYGTVGRVLLEKVKDTYRRRLTRRSAL